MHIRNTTHPSRRAFIAASAGLAVTTVLPFGDARAAGTRDYRLAAAPGSTQLAGAKISGNGGLGL